MAGRHVVFVDASSLIVLARAGLLGLLRDLFEVVQITAAVRNEAAPAQDLPGELAILKAIEGGLVRIVDPSPPIIHGLRDFLHEGEATCIEAAVACPGSLLILDEQTARSEATKRGLRFTGAVGVLIEAKRRGHIASVASGLKAMVDHGFYLSTSLVEAALRRAGEMPQSPASRDEPRG